VATEAEVKRTPEERLDRLENEVAWLRQRLSVLLPERNHCPHCKAIVHKAAKSCAACGRSWGKEPDPNTGLPT